MRVPPFKPPRKPILYAAKTFIGGIVCWYTLTWFGVLDPIWGVITIILVTDPDIDTTTSLAKARIINTIVGCFMSLISLMLFDYSPLVVLATAALTVFLITAYERYPSNWRLAPVTVVILMDAARQASTHADELHYALMRAGEIAFGCLIAWFLAHIYTHLIRAD